MMHDEKISAPQSGDAQATVADHRIHLLYLSKKLDWSSPPSLTLEGLRDLPIVLSGDDANDDAKTGRVGRWLPSDWLPAMEHHASGPVWSPIEQRHASLDLLPAVARLLNGEDDTRARVYEPTDEAWRAIERLLSGQGLWLDRVKSDQRRRRRLMLKPSKASRRRLERVGQGVGEHGIALHVLKPRLFVFRSGLAVMDWPVRVQGDGHGLDTVIEANVAFSRFNTLAWLHGDSEEGRFTMGDLARTFMEGAEAATAGQRRVFSMSYAKLEAGVSDAEHRRAAYYLAKHYTSDYGAPANTATDMRLIETFDNVTRAAAPEGAAVVVRRYAEGTSQFMEGYRAMAFAPAYLPLAVLAVHEQAALTGLTTDAAFWPDLQKSRDKAIGTLAATRDLAVQVRSAYSFARVSNIAGHDAWYEALQSVMRMPALRESLSEDVREAEQLMAAYQQADVQRRFGWMSVLGGASIAAFTTFTLLHDFLLLALTNEPEAQVTGLIALGGAVLVFAAMSLILIPRMRARWRSGMISADSVTLGASRRASK